MPGGCEVTVSGLGSPFRATAPRRFCGTAGVQVGSALAADAVAVPVELLLETRVARVDGRCPGGFDGAAVLVEDPGGLRGWSRRRGRGGFGCRCERRGGCGHDGRRAV